MSKFGDYSISRSCAAVFLWMLASIGYAVDSPQLPALQSPLASSVLLTDSTYRDGRIIAVGAYGNIISSPDGVSWRQGAVPTRRLLTAVEFINANEGWVAGHDTLILHTSDGGQNWEIQYEDRWPNNDLPKPILDLLFVDSLRGYAIGAFGLMLATEDGGKTWATVDTTVLYDLLDEAGLEPEPNLYGITQFGDGYLVVGELGTLLYFSPEDATTGQGWQILSSPYEGSFFGAQVFSSGVVVIYGLRGHMFYSLDKGQTWREISTETISNINDVVELPDGHFIAVGDGGIILRLRIAHETVEKTIIAYPGFDNLTSVESLGDNKLLLVGQKGAQIFSLEQAR